MHVMAGALKGLALCAPKGERTRPTSAKVRAALATVLTPYVAGAAVLDLYAGTGGLGLELLSRGAGSATFVESDRCALKALRSNVSAASQRLAARMTIVPIPVRSALAGLAGPFDIVIADPPYDLPGTELTAVLELLQPRLAPDADIVIERRAQAAELVWPGGLTAARQVSYGDTVLCYGHAS